MRTNSEGLGTRVSIEGEGLDVEYIHTTPLIEPRAIRDSGCPWSRVGQGNSAPAPALARRSSPVRAGPPDRHDPRPLPNTTARREAVPYFSRGTVIGLNAWVTSWAAVDWVISLLLEFTASPTAMRLSPLRPASSKPSMAYIGCRSRNRWTRLPISIS